MRVGTIALAVVAALLFIPLPAVADSCTEHSQRCQSGCSARANVCRDNCTLRGQNCLQTKSNGTCTYLDGSGKKHENLQCS
jgi:hypothetical protein